MKELLVYILIALLAIGLVISTLVLHDGGLAVLCGALAVCLIWLLNCWAIEAQHEVEQHLRAHIRVLTKQKKQH